MTQSTSRNTSSAWLPLLAGLSAFAIAIAVFWSFDAPWTLRGDNITSVFPLNLEAFRAWRAGRVPFWSGGMSFGFPLLADPTSMSLYWPNLLAFLATEDPHLRAYDLSVAFHAGILVAGTVWLLRSLGVRRWVALFGGALILLAPMHLWHASTAIAGYAAVSWWPSMLVAAEMLSRPGPRGRYLLLGWMSLASSMTAHPELACYGGWVAVAWLVTRTAGAPLWHRLAFSVILGVGGLALAAPQLLPSMLLSAETAPRVPPAAVGETAVVFAAPALFYPAVVERVPSFLGAWTLLLAVFALVGRAPRSGLLSLLGVATFLASLGAAGPFYGALHALPVFDLFDKPMNFKLVTELAVVLLGALGFDRLLAGAPSGFARRCAIVFGVMAMAEHGTWAGSRVPLRLVVPGASEAGFAELHEKMTASGLVVHATRVTRPPVARSMETVGLGNLPLVEGVPLAGGAGNSLLPPRYSILMSALGSSPGPSRPGLSYFGIRYLLDIQPPATPRDPTPCLTLSRNRGLLLAGTGGDTCLYLNRDRPPLVAVPQRVSRAADVDSMVQDLALQLRTQLSVLTFLPPQTECSQEVLDANSSAASVRLFQHKLRDQVPVVAPPDVVAEKVRSFGRATIVDYQPGQIAFTSSTNKPGFAVVRESYFEGWEAFVDGEPAAIYPAAGLFFAVPIPAGKSDVFVAFRAPGFQTGVRIALGWVALACVGELLRRMAELVAANRADDGSAADAAR